MWGTLVPTGSRTARAAHLYAMGRALAVDPVVFESEWAESFRERAVGGLGSLEETIRRIASRQGVEPSEASVRRALGIRLTYSRSMLESCAPVLADLDLLREAGIRLAVVSDTSEETPRLWTSTPLGSRFRAAVFSCQEGFCKPDPRVYRRALERLEVRAEESAFVGDGGSRELSGANAIGLRAFLYRCPGQKVEPEYRYDPDVDWTGPTLGNLRELAARRV